VIGGGPHPVDGTDRPRRILPGREPLGRRALGVAAGIVADRLLGEPPVRPHPVAAFGSAMGKVEQRLYADSGAAGAVHAAVGLGLGAATGRLVGRVAPATYVAVAGRALAEAAAAVSDALERGDLDRARARLPALVGRDPSGLGPDEIARAVIESVAENTVDAVVAPALWGLAAGAPGVLGHRAVNTLDAMVGHRSDRYRRYGTASARLDDAAAWIPSRATAALVALVRPAASGAVVAAVRRDAPAHPSPNAGVAEAAFAAALGLQLGGEVRYGPRVEQRPLLGDGKPPAPSDIPAALRLADHVGLALAGLLAAGSLVGGARERWRGKMDAMGCDTR
jgi:adenosylcobinamide-phosphate synthase